MLYRKDSILLFVCLQLFTSNEKTRTTTSVDEGREMPSREGNCYSQRERVPLIPETMTDIKEDKSGNEFSKVCTNAKLQKRKRQLYLAFRLANPPTVTVLHSQPITSCQNIIPHG